MADKIRERRIGTGRLALLVAAVLVLSGTLLLPLLLPGQFGADGVPVDLQVYRYGGRSWTTDQHALYSGGLAVGPAGEFILPFTYPPLAAILFTPLAVLPAPAAVVLLTWLGVAALALTCVLAARRAGWSGRHALVAGLSAAAVAVVLDPVRMTVFLGQVNLVLLGLVAADCLVERPRWPRGALIGLAAAIKLTPLVFLLFFLPRRQWRPAATAVGTFLGLSLVVAAALPRASADFWTSAVWQPSRIGTYTEHLNQSLRGLVARASGGGTTDALVWLVLCLIVAALTWVAVGRLRQAGNDLAAVLVVAVAGLLISPMSWVHHWVWVAPAIPLVVATLRRRRTVVGVTAAVVATLVFLVGPSLLVAATGASWDGMGWSWWQHLTGNSYVLIGVAVVLCAALLRVERREPADAGMVTANLVHD